MVPATRALHVVELYEFGMIGPVHERRHHRKLPGSQPAQRRVFVSAVRPEVTQVLAWYREHARDLPWRRPDVGPWAVMVSEFMLQQTPVARVLGPFHAWMERWPTPDDLAAEPSSAAVAAWGRLGYPRRALRLHAAATAISTEHDGRVPEDLDALRALPGVGEYTAAAIASFAFGQRQLVLDTNVRRVLARVIGGVAFPPNTLTRAERDQAAAWLPYEPADAALWAVASMELGATVCSARSPQCEVCPIQAACRWYALGRPAHTGPPRRGQPWQGTDRQCRGRILALAREATDPVPREEALAQCPDRSQAERCLDSLLSDGLLHTHGDSITL